MVLERARPDTFALYLPVATVSTVIAVAVPQELTEKFLLYAQLELMSSDEAQIKGLSEKPAAPTLDIVLTASEKSARQLNRGEDLKFNTIEFEHRIGAAHLERMLKELISNACNFSPSAE